MKQTEINKKPSETKVEHLTEWEKDWYDPKIDLKCFDEGDHKAKQNLLGKMRSLGAFEPDEMEYLKNLYKLKSFTLLNSKLNSDHSSIKKTEILFLLSVELLERLKNQRYKDLEVRSELLWFLLIGVESILKRFMIQRTFVQKYIPVQQQLLLPSFLNIDDTKISYQSMRLDSKKYNSLPPESNFNSDELINAKPIHINISDIHSVINQQHSMFSYIFFQKLMNYLTMATLQIKNEMILLTLSTSREDAEIFGSPARKTFKQITDVFIKFERANLDNEQKEAFSGLTMLPTELKELIHCYSDLPIISFYNNKKKIPMWEKDWYDPDTDLACFNNFTFESGRARFDIWKKINVINETKSLVRHNVINLSSYTLINDRLNSADSQMKKTGIIFLLCSAMLGRLKFEWYKKINIKIKVLLCLSFGIRSLLLKYVNGFHTIYLKLPPPQKSLKLKFFKVNAKQMTFCRQFLDLDQYKSLLLGRRTIKDVNKFNKSDTAHLDLEEVKNVFAKMLPDFEYNILNLFIEFFVETYNYLVDSAAPIMIQILNELSRQKINFAHYYFLQRLEIAFKVLDSLREPFIKYKIDIIDNEREKLFKDIKLFPQKMLNIEKLIHGYSDLPGITFFSVRKIQNLKNCKTLPTVRR